MLAQQHSKSYSNEQSSRNLLVQNSMETKGEEFSFLVDFVSEDILWQNSSGINSNKRAKQHLTHAHMWRCGRYGERNPLPILGSKATKNTTYVYQKNNNPNITTTKNWITPQQKAHLHTIIWFWVYFILVMQIHPSLINIFMQSQKSSRYVYHFKHYYVHYAAAETIMIA